MDKEELIPVEHVLDDMYSNSGVESAARDYYYLNYATDEEKRIMEFEDKVATIVSCAFWMLVIIGMVVCVIYG